jgi:AcrR family transcriptional regulator
MYRDESRMYSAGLGRVKFNGTVCILSPVARRYELKRRAERQDVTRQRIVDATIGLHETIGAAQTTISEIAKRAGVGRVTVYRHFPDEEALFAACSGHYFAQHPFPDVERWRQIPAPLERLRAGLAESYAWHDENRKMIAMALAEARDLPIMAPYHRFWDDAADVLTQAWRVRGRRRVSLEAAIALALSFDTYRTLTQEQHLTDDQAIELMVRLAESV